MAIAGVEVIEARISHLAYAPEIADGGVDLRARDATGDQRRHPLLMSQRKRFLLRIDQRLYDVLQRWAADDLRSVNGQIEFLLTDAARRAGRLSKAKTPIDDGRPVEGGDR